MYKGKKVAVLFPGQGSQFLGMGQEFVNEDPEAARLMESAEAACGFPLRQLCLEGPMEELTRAIHLQPAITVTNLICWQAVRKAGIEPDFLAGHSLGEYSALCVGGVLSVEDTLGLVTERGRLMEREGEKNPGGMQAVLGFTLAEVEEILAGLTGGGTVTAANHNSEKQVVISGDFAGLQEAAAVVADRGGRAIPLKVSVANHSPLVADAVPDFREAMARVDFKSPATPILFNVTAAEETEPEVIRDIMARQIASRVRWLEIINRMVEQGVTVFLEVGPKNVLTGLLRKILPKGHDCQRLQIDSPEKLSACLEKI